jgi:lipoate-protein ligase B
LINPCGLNKPVTSMTRVLGRPVALDEVRPVVARTFAEMFQIALEPVSLGALWVRLGAATSPV